MGSLVTSVWLAFWVIKSCGMSLEGRDRVAPAPRAGPGGARSAGDRWCWNYDTTRQASFRAGHIRKQDEYDCDLPNDAELTMPTDYATHGPHDAGAWHAELAAEDDPLSAPPMIPVELKENGSLWVHQDYLPSNKHLRSPDNTEIYNRTGQRVKLSTIPRRGSNDVYLVLPYDRQVSLERKHEALVLAIRRMTTYHRRWVANGSQTGGWFVPLRGGYRWDAPAPQAQGAPHGPTAAAEAGGHYAAEAAARWVVDQTFGNVPAAAQVPAGSSSNRGAIAASAWSAFPKPTRARPTRPRSATVQNEDHRRTKAKNAPPAEKGTAAGSAGPTAAVSADPTAAGSAGPTAAGQFTQPGNLLRRALNSAWHLDRSQLRPPECNRLPPGVPPMPTRSPPTGAATESAPPAGTATALAPPAGAATESAPPDAPPMPTKWRASWAKQESRRTIYVEPTAKASSAGWQAGSSSAGSEEKQRKSQAVPAVCSPTTGSAREWLGEEHVPPPGQPPPPPPVTPPPHPPPYHQKPDNFMMHGPIKIDGDECYYLEGRYRKVLP